MILLYEYEARELFEKYGIPVEEAAPAFTAEEAYKAALEITPPYVVKAQVLTTGRGKAGGVIAAETPEEVEEVSRKLLKATIRGLPVRGVLVAHRVSIIRELYLSVVLDRSLRRPVVLASRLGGVDVEEAARRAPEEVLKVGLDPLVGLRHYVVLRVAKHLEVSESELSRILEGIYAIFNDYDCVMVEINPLAVTPDGLVAIDRRVLMDEAAATVNPKVKVYSERRLAELSREEREAKKWGFSYVPLNGDIGVVGNGAGLTMATMDLVASYGGRAACFLDIGGGASRDRVKAAVSLLLANPRVKVVLVNVLGGITRCDEVAQGVVDALREVGSRKPTVVRLAGTLEEKGREILAGAGIETLVSMEEAARRAVEVSSHGGLGQ